MTDEYDRVLRATMPDIAGTFMMDAKDLERHGFVRDNPIGTTEFWKLTLRSGNEVQLMSSFLNASHQDHRLWDLITPNSNAVRETCKLLGLAWMPMTAVPALIEGIEGSTASFYGVFLAHRPELRILCPYRKIRGCDGTCCDASRVSVAV